MTVCMPALLLSLILFHIMPVCECSMTVTGFVGLNVTLPCNYTVQNNGELNACWGRGEVPYSGCNQVIILTDGIAVTWRKSHRYQLSGDLKKGNVSLTIVNAEKNDSGVYGCRVEIPGWFNDLKRSVTLTINAALSTTTLSPKSTVPPTDPANPTRQTASSLTQGHDRENSIGSSTANTLHDSDLMNSSYFVNSAVIMLLLMIVPAMALWFYKRKQQRKARAANEGEQQMDISAVYGNLDNHIGLNTRGMAVENIYEQNDLNDYEFCP